MQTSNFKRTAKEKLVQVIIYADEITIKVRSRRSLKNFPQKLEVHSRKEGEKINQYKTELEGSASIGEEVVVRHR